MNDTVSVRLSLRRYSGMRALGVCALLLAVASCQGYGGGFQRSSFSSSSSSSSSYGSGQSSTLQQTPQINPWGYAHFNEVRELANQLKQRFNSLSQGSSNFGYAASWTGKLDISCSAMKKNTLFKNNDETQSSV